MNPLFTINHQLHDERLDIYDAKDIEGNTYPHDVLRRFHNMIDIIMEAEYPDSQVKKENAELRKALKMAKKEMKMWDMELECEREWQEYKK